MSADQGVTANEGERPRDLAAAARPNGFSERCSVSPARAPQKRILGDCEE